MEYNIVSSGSDGNCVIINENIMIDCGIKTKDFAKIDISKIKYVLITHSHGDHIKKSNIKKLLSKTIYVNRETFDKYADILVSAKKVVVLDVNEVYKLGDFNMIPFEVYHDIQCHGFSFIGQDISVLYSTDLAYTKDLPNLQYDYIFLEANYDVNKIIKASEDKRYKSRVKSNFRHLSKQDSLQYVACHLKKGGKYEPLHKSKEFY